MGLYLLSIIIVAIGVVLDQFTKSLAVANLQDAPIPIIENVFELRYLENRGAAFGMLQNQQVFFLITGTIMLILFSYMYVKLPHTKRFLPLRACFVAIAAGAIGNMIDRLSLNYVIDFFYFKLIDFPIFNVADIYVTCATFVLIFLIVFYYKEEEIDTIFHLFKKKGVTQES